MSTQKPWERPWSMEEIIENSEKWNLAGDVALLNTLKSFADNLISKTSEINNNLNKLTNELDKRALELNIAQNEFQSLRNSQFIESRVYEDDETLPQTENNEKLAEETEPDRTEDIRLAAVKGLKVLEQYFDKIEVSVSDSEDEELDLPNYVLRPKDLYIDRPLPYVIGSEKWHKNWHVGLEDSSSDSETEKVSDKFSESDSESDLPPIIQDRSQIKGTSDTSSEIDFSQKTNKISSKQDGQFQSSDSEDQNSVQASVSNRNFAEQLAAKLGNVIKQEAEEPEINRRPIQKNSQYGDLFFDEPPPLDEPKGLFSGGSGLFDDDDEDIQYSTPIESKIEESPKSIAEPELFDKENDIFNTKSKPIFPINKPPMEEPPDLDGKKKPVGGVSIFGGKDVFNKKLLKQPPSSSDEETKDKKEEIVAKKKIDLFQGDDEDIFKTAEKSVSSKKINLFDSDDKNKKDSKSNEEVKKVSLFDDDDDLFKDDLFSTSNNKNKFTSSLFDDVEENDLFLNKSDDKPKPKKNLFEDLLATPDHKNSINVDGKSEIKSGVFSEEKKIAVIPDESGSKVSSSSNLFEAITESKDSVFDETLIFKPEAPKPRFSISLFDSPPPETDDLFSDENLVKKEPAIEEFSKDNPDFSEKTEKKFKSSLFDSSIDEDFFEEKTSKNKFNTDIFHESWKETETVDTTPTNLRLFDPVPPPDDEWESKSENIIISDDNQSLTDQDEIETQKANLFSEEPPSLDFLPKTNSRVSDMTKKLDNQPKEEIKEFTASSPGKLKHNLNINVSALIPGSFPPKQSDLSKSPTEKKDSFDATDNVEVLHSVTKDRVKVPLRRRPSTRRGRKAVLRQSSSDFKLDENEDIINENISSTNPTFDISQSPNFIDAKPLKDSEVEITPTKSQCLFESTSSKNEGLFEEAEAKPLKSQESNAKIDLFGEDDDDDIFSSKKVQIQQTKNIKKSLFDDDDDDTDDDDDIFKRSTETKIKNSEVRTVTERKIAKVSSIKRLENTKVDDDDPLSALLK